MSLAFLLTAIRSTLMQVLAVLWTTTTIGRVAWYWYPVPDSLSHSLSRYWHSGRSSTATPNNLKGFWPGPGRRRGSRRRELPVQRTTRPHTPRKNRRFDLDENAVEPPVEPAVLPGSRFTAGRRLLGCLERRCMGACCSRYESWSWTSGSGSGGLVCGL